MSPAPGLMNSVCGWWRGSAAAEAPRPCDLVIGGGETLEAGTLALVRKCDRRPDGGRARTASLVQTAPALSLTADRGAWLARYCRPDSLGRVQDLLVSSYSLQIHTFMAADETWPGGQPRQEAAAQGRCLEITADPGPALPRYRRPDVARSLTMVLVAGPRYRQDLDDECVPL